MRNFFRPASAPEWLGDVLTSIRAALSDIWPTPVRLNDYTTTGLPPAADWKQGLAYDATTGGPKYSNGTSWAEVGSALSGLTITPASQWDYTQAASPVKLKVAGGTAEFSLAADNFNAYLNCYGGTLQIASNGGAVQVGGNVTGSGSFKSTGTAGIGYATGAGGTVTQLTSKATGVTLNKTCGDITLNGAALAAATIVSFTLTNSTIAAGDVIILNHAATGTFGAYALNARCAAGSATIDVRNNTAGSLSEAIVLRFAVIKAVTA